MSDEQAPDIEEIKERIEIPVEEDDIAGLKADEKANGPDLAEEFKKFGRQFAETIEAAWTSEERVRVETEIREGVHSFVDEIDAVIREAKSSEKAEKLMNDAAGVKSRAESSEFGTKARDGIIQGLAWLSDEFGKLADQFAASEKSPEDIDDAPAEEADSNTE